MFNPLLVLDYNYNLDLTGSGPDWTQKASDLDSTFLVCVSLLQSLADKEGRKCLFIIKCSDKSFEISASDKKKKQEWIQGVFHCSLCSTIKGPSTKR